MKAFYFFRCSTSFCILKTATRTKEKLLKFFLTLLALTNFLIYCILMSTLANFLKFLLILLCLTSSLRRFTAIRAKPIILKFFFARRDLLLYSSISWRLFCFECWTRVFILWIAKRVKEKALRF